MIRFTRMQEIQNDRKLVQVKGKVKGPCVEKGIIRQICRGCKAQGKVSNFKQSQAIAANRSNRARCNC